jgi:uncharacterized protein (DUF1800 family)
MNFTDFAIQSVETVARMLSKQRKARAAQQPVAETDFAFEERQKRFRAANRYARQVRERMLKEGKISPITSKDPKYAKAREG